MLYDHIISGGTIVDGTGAERFLADIGIKHGRVAAIGALSAAEAENVIDASGLIVAPGFVDVHTHYDAQLFWDPWARPSSCHGVTTVIAGLCGFSLQPMSPQAAAYLVPMLSKVEDIPIESLEAGVPLDWRSFEEFRQRLTGQLGINAGFATGHSALRQQVMGNRAKGNQATADEVAQMQALLRQCLSEGALGFSTSNSATHNDHLGEPVPSRFADYDEFVALAAVCREFEGTHVQIQPGMDFDDFATRLMTGMSVASQRTVNWNAMFTQNFNEDTTRLIERQLAISDHARESGGRVIGLSVPIAGGAHVDLIRGCGAFDIIPGWAPFFTLSVAERIAVLKDPSYRDDMKQSLLKAAADGFGLARTFEAGERLLVESGATPEVAKYDGWSIKRIADETGCAPVDALFDIAVADGLATLFTFLQVSDDAESYAKRVNLWRDDRLCPGGSDAGAHVETIDSFNFFTRLLAKPVREYGLLSLEECVHYLTQAPASLVGLKDRGVLNVGAWADICIFDKDTVASRPIETRADFPGGATRLFAGAEGIERVMVAGTTILERGETTGALPGQFIQREIDTNTVGVAH